VWLIAAGLFIWLCENGIGAKINELNTPLDTLTIA